jgi:hypothetical protein
LIIFIAGFSIGFALLFIPFPFSILILIGFEIWQISDLIVIIEIQQQTNHLAKFAKLIEKEVVKRKL